MKEEFVPNVHKDRNVDYGFAFTLCFIHQLVKNIFYVFPSLQAVGRKSLFTFLIHVLRRP